MKDEKSAEERRQASGDLTPSRRKKTVPVACLLSRKPVEGHYSTFESDSDGDADTQVLQETVVIHKPKEDNLPIFNYKSPLLSFVSLNEEIIPSFQLSTKDIGKCFKLPRSFPKSDFSLTGSATEVPERIPLISVCRTNSAHPGAIGLVKEVDDKRVSATHFHLEMGCTMGGTEDIKGVRLSCWLTDKSTNGTFINGRLVGRGKCVQVYNGDEIRLLPLSKDSENDSVGYLFRNFTELREIRNGDKLTTALEANLQCSICSSLFHRPVTVSPCEHSFCGACFSEWLQRSVNCPICRQTMTSVKKNRLLDSMTEDFVVAFPKKPWVRSEEEKKRMDMKDGMKNHERMLIHPLRPPTAVRDHEEAREHTSRELEMLWNARRQATEGLETTDYRPPPQVNRGAYETGAASEPRRGRAARSEAAGCFLM